MSDINISDDEIESLMAELEAQNAQIAADQARAAPTPEPTPEPVAEEQAAAAAPWEEPTPAATVDADLAALEAELNEEAFEKKLETEANEDVLPEPAAEPEPVAVAAVPVPEPVATPAPVTAAKPAPSKIDPDDEPDAGREGPPGMNAGLQFYVDVNGFRAETRVTEATLDDAMFAQAGLRAFYGAQAANAEAQAARLKMKFDIIEATLYDKHRKALALSGEKTTEKMVENAVKMDARWMKAKSLVIEAETIATINKNLVESLKDRRDMIIQLGADRRDEYKGAARVMAERNDQNDTAARARAAAAAAMQRNAA